MRFRRDSIYIAIIILLAGLAGQSYYSYRYQPRAAREVQVYYSQDRELNREIIRVAQEADRFVYFAVYTFTRADIKDALLAAKYRGLDVQGLVDKDQTARVESQRAIVKELRDAGIPIYEQSHSAIMHIKAIVTDKGFASGSFNWTSAATNLNDEVLEVGRDEALRRQYEDTLKSVFARYNK